jgi:DNA-binding protein YbaB
MKKQILLNRKSWLNRLIEFNNSAINIVNSSVSDEEKEALLDLNESAYKDCFNELSALNLFQKKSISVTENPHNTYPKD